MTKLFFLLLLFATVCSQAQKITNFKSIAEGDFINISYNLSGAEDQKFKVSLFASVDGGENYNIEVTSATGDIGSKVEAGKGKKIKWEAAKEVSIKLSEVKVTLRAEAIGMAPKKKSK